MTIEHLAPQSPADSKPLKNVGCLGNLILVDENTNDKLANKRFDQKRRILQDAGYFVPDIFKTAVELNDELIEKRTLELSRISREKVWAIN